MDAVKNRNVFLTGTKWDFFAVCIGEPGPTSALQFLNEDYNCHPVALRSVLRSTWRTERFSAELQVLKNKDFMNI